MIVTAPASPAGALALMLLTLTNPLATSSTPPALPAVELVLMVTVGKLMLPLPAAPSVYGVATGPTTPTVGGAKLYPATIVRVPAVVLSVVAKLMVLDVQSHLLLRLLEGSSLQTCPAGSLVRL